MNNAADASRQVRTHMDRLIRHMHACSEQGLVLFNRFGEVIDANKNFAELLGCTAGYELRGRQIRELLYFQELDVVEELLPADGLCHPIPEHISLPCFAPNSIIPIRIGDERGFLAYVTKAKEESSRRLLERFSDTFMKDVNLGVMLIDLTYTLVNVSDTACRILGYEREELMDRSLDDIFASVPEQHRLVQRTILDGVIVRNYAVSWSNSERRYDLLLDSNVLRDQQGCIVGAYVMFKDVSNLRSLEAQVQRSDRLAMIGQIAAGTAHEIRNPLTSIKGFLQILKSTFETKDMLKERSFTEVMLSEIDRINELVSEFLLLSKQRETILAKVDLQTVLHGILPIIQNEAVLHNTEVRYEAAKALPWVTADQEMLKQVFLNICKNGIEAMPEGGVLTVTEKIDQSERKVFIDIHDTGPGIPLFLVDKIFDPFFTTKEEGTGLGLSVCQRIIHDIGGTIRVSSKGYGTTFTVGIPFS